MVRTVPTMSRSSGAPCSSSCWPSLLAAPPERSPTCTRSGFVHGRWIRLPERSGLRLWTSLSIGDRIGLERTACHGTCPPITLILKADGTVRYLGEETCRGSDRARVKCRSVSSHRLATLAVNSGYLKLESSYGPAGSGRSPATYTTVFRTGNGSSSAITGIWDRSNWAFQQAIDSLLLEIQWDDQKSRTVQQPRSLTGNSSIGRASSPSRIERHWGQLPPLDINGRTHSLPRHQGLLVNGVRQTSP